MLLKLLDHLKKVEVLKRQYVGVVVDNADPKLLGRVKCVIAGLIEGDKAVLPWVFPKTPAGQGGGGNNSALAVPDLNSQLIIEFPFDDVYSPFYTGFWQSDETHQGKFNEDYPNTIGWEMSDGTFYRVNKTRQIADFYHVGGSRIRHNQDGSIDIISPTAINLMSSDEKTSIRIDAINGAVQTQNRDVGVLSGQKTKIVSSSHEVAVGSVKDSTTGPRELFTGGGYKHTVGGSASEATVSSKAVSIGANLNETIAGKTSTIMGLDREELIALGNDEKTLTAGDRTTTITLGNYKITLVAGNYDVDVVAGNVKLHTAAGSAEISNVIGKVAISETGDINLKNAVGGMHIDPAGMVAFGSSAAELLSILNDTLTAIQSMTMGSGVGPTSPPINLAQFVAAQAKLTLIMGSL